MHLAPGLPGDVHHVDLDRSTLALLRRQLRGPGRTSSRHRGPGLQGPVLGGGSLRRQRLRDRASSRERLRRIHEAEIEGLIVDTDTSWRSRTPSTTRSPRPEALAPLHDGRRGAHLRVSVGGGCSCSPTPAPTAVASAASSPKQLKRWSTRSTADRPRRSNQPARRRVRGDRGGRHGLEGPSREGGDRRPRRCHAGPEAQAALGRELLPEHLARRGGGLDHPRARRVRTSSTRSWTARSCWRRAPSSRRARA